MWKFCISLAAFVLGVLSTSVSLSMFQPNAEPATFKLTLVPQADRTVSEPAKIDKATARFVGAGVNSDEEVEQFWLTFQRAVADDDRDQVAAMAHYPLKVYFFSDPLDRSGYRHLKNRTAFLRAYDKIFDKALKDRIANTSINDIWARYDGILMPRGEIWIGVFCLDKECEGDYEVKLRTIHANSVFIDRSKH